MAQIAVVLSEKVDTTVSKGVLRIIGSAIGGTFGASTLQRNRKAYEDIQLNRGFTNWHKKKSSTDYAP